MHLCYTTTSYVSYYDVTGRPYCKIPFRIYQGHPTANTASRFWVKDIENGGPISVRGGVTLRKRPGANINLNTICAP